MISSEFETNPVYRKVCFHEPLQPGGGRFNKGLHNILILNRVDNPIVWDNHLCWLIPGDQPVELKAGYMGGHVHGQLNRADFSDDVELHELKPNEDGPGYIALWEENP